MSNGPILLGLDASTGRCSVALMHDGAVIERASSEGLGHSAILLTLTEAVLAEAGRCAWCAGCHRLHPWPGRIYRRADYGWRGAGAGHGAGSACGGALESAGGR